MKKGLITALLMLVFNGFVLGAYYRSGAYYPPDFGGSDVDTLTTGSRVSSGLALGFDFLGEPRPYGSIKTDAFIQSGGTHDVEGPLSLEGLILLTGVGGRAHTHFYTPAYRLRGGRLNCHDLSITIAQFTQSGGTNHVTGELALDGKSYEGRTSYGLDGGRLISSNVVIQGASFSQYGGVHVVRSLLAVHGNRYGPSYHLAGGKLFARDILLTGGATFLHRSRGVIRQSGTLTLAAGSRWSAARGLTELGVLELVSSTFPSGISLPRVEPTTLRFAESSGIAWAPDALLVIYYWRAKANGAPLHRIYFGTDKDGLTPEQAAQIRFRNPYGYPPGDYPGRIGRGGEVRPAPLP